MNLLTSEKLKKLKILRKIRQWTLEDMIYLSAKLKEPRKTYNFQTPGVNEMLKEIDETTRRLDIAQLKKWGQKSSDLQKEIDTIKEA